MLWGYRAHADAKEQKKTISISLNPNATVSVASAPVSTVSTSSVPLPEVSTETDKPLSFTLDLSIDSNLRNENDPDYAASTTLGFEPAYKVTRLLTLAGQVALEQKLYANQETQVSNTTLVLSRQPVHLSDKDLLSPSLFGILPTNEKDRNENTLRGGAGFGLSFLRSFSLLKRDTSLSYALSGLKNFHEYENNNLYGANLSHRVRHTLTFRHELSPKLSCEIVGRYQTGWTYQNALRTVFLISEQLSLKINETNSVYIGHINTGAALKANGVDSNIRFYDSSNSSYVAGMTVSY